MSTSYIRWFQEISSQDLSLVGGKNASLGEMYQKLHSQGILVPNGFATTSSAYYDFLEYNHLTEKIRLLLQKAHKDLSHLEKASKEIRELILHSSFPKILEKEISSCYRMLSKGSQADVAVRSSATAEDLPDSSFAGQQETFLHVQGISSLLLSCKKCFASLFTARAISYRETKGFDHLQIALSIGIQKMVRSDLGSSGVLFTVDTDSGFPDVVLINASWGLGENIVQGAVVPDEYIVHKPLLSHKKYTPILEKKLGTKTLKMVYRGGSTHNIKTTDKERRAFVLNDQEILTLARWGALIEKHYGTAMDVEWAKDGKTDQIFIVQARPETVQSRKAKSHIETYTLQKSGKKISQGLAIGNAIVSGKAQIIQNASQIHTFEEGSILVTRMTSPDWVPIMQKAAAIITEEGGRTSHAAIVSRELGVPAIVGAHNAMKAISSKELITVCCAEGEIGSIYQGMLPFKTTKISLDRLPKPPVEIMMNMANPIDAFSWWKIPCQGVGLARMEFIISNIIKIHPMALVHYDKLQDKAVKNQIKKLTQGYSDLQEYFIDHLSQGIAKIAASRYPYPVIVRMSDFKTNEYAQLIGGEAFEPKEENPMLGFRGASRYYDPRYKEGFALECAAIRRAREKIGMKNIIVMIPFCRTLEEAKKVLAVMAKSGLERGRKDLQVYMMAEIPSNVILAEEFAEFFDGFSIGSNDLTQLTLGVDRDSQDLASLFDERNEAVKKMILSLLKAAKKKRRKVGICGQAPSDYPEFASFLVDAGIDSLSLNPDSIVNTILQITKKRRSPKGR